MGTPLFAASILARLLKDSHFEIAAVYTRPDRRAGRGLKEAFSEVKKLALASGLLLFQPESLNTPEATTQLSELAPDVIVVASYGLILPESILSIAPAINVHASLLPQFRGAAPVQAAVLESWKSGAKTGISIMRMEKGLDSGPIYSMWATPSSGKTVTELTRELASMGAEALVRTLWSLDKIEPLPQEGEGISWAGKVTRKDGELDLLDSAAVLEARIRALQPWPGCHVTLDIDGRQLSVNILKAHIASSSEKPEPGKVLVDGGLLIGCGDGWLSIDELKPQNRKAMDWKSFLNGYLSSHVSRLRVMTQS